MPSLKHISLLRDLWILPPDVRSNVYARSLDASPAFVEELNAFLQTMVDFQDALSRKIISHDPSFPKRLQKKLHDFLAGLKQESDAHECAQLERLNQELTP